ncbi:PREDICTED: alcohol-forming fatty acyl-CoA reductase-like [Ipomoea nil]|uniref:alcohol-forming fatty acyl-CoA reductase-like n=1 Tax=Ipomoea nil TaxID=35883 RepID=UPI000901C648|nr:PREDICTED: alcohol-forming fatty acyl-CoA reductase-like [Ipomoea nil]
MELGSAVEFLENRAILVTGATGFLAKIFVEKILRVQPNVKKLYLLLRAADTMAAVQRFNSEVMEKDLFRAVKEKYGKKLNNIISEKVSIVAGDVTFEKMGVKDSHLLDQMQKEVDVVVNLAAITDFYERYDVAIGINTMGPTHLLHFAKKCKKLKVFLHVSTAYVFGERDGLLQESTLQMGETLNGRCGLDIDRENEIIEETLKNLIVENASDESITLAMKELGIQRARTYGWPNTYVFTKAMGEMLLGKLRDDIPLLILRPTIITSTYKEPFLGWVEGVRTIDSLVLGYAKGRLSCFLGDPKTIIDVIPADMVVNAMIVAMVGHADERGSESIYHIGSSVSNPLEYGLIRDYGHHYFTKHPWIGKDGKPILVGKMTVLSTMASFQTYMTIRYLLPLKGLEILNTICCKYFQRKCDEKNRKFKFVMKLVDLYRPYLFFKGIYDDMNTEKLRRAAKEGGIETELFYFDPKAISWEDYFMKAHFPGLVKHVF